MNKLQSKIAAKLNDEELKYFKEVCSKAFNYDELALSVLRNADYVRRGYRPRIHGNDKYARNTIQRYFGK